MNESIRIGRVIGIQIRIHYSWFIIFGIVTISLATAYFPREYQSGNPLLYWMPAIFTALILFGSVLIHELAHSYVAIKNGIEIRGINLFIFGGVAELTGEPKTAIAELKIAAAGPFASIIIGSVFFLIETLFGHGLSVVILSPLRYLKFINFALALFNLVPGFPLDGGRLLRAILWKRSGDIKAATKTASRFGQGFAYILIFFGVFQAFSGRFLSGLWMVFIGFFLEQASKSSYQQLLLRQFLTGVKTADIMTKEVVSVGGDILLRSLIDDYFLKYRYSSYPVMDGGRTIGLISVKDVKDVPGERWGDIRAKEAMTPLDDKIIARPEDEAVHVLNRMLKDSVSKVVVIKDRHLLGILTLQDVMRLFKIKTDLGE
jgi:Zn-dependent protease/predicted transcriptional regulator